MQHTHKVKLILLTTLEKSFNMLNKEELELFLNLILQDMQRVGVRLLKIMKGLALLEMDSWDLWTLLCTKLTNL